MAIFKKDKGDKDKNGHGTLVASVVSNQKRNSNGKFHGVAPDSAIIPVQVLDEEGKVNMDMFDPIIYGQGKYYSGLELIENIIEIVPEAGK